MNDLIEGKSAAEAKAFREGQNAYDAGLGREANKYDPASPEWFQWEVGFNAEMVERLGG